MADLNIPMTFKVKYLQSGEMRRMSACDSMEALFQQFTDYWGNQSYTLSYLDEDDDCIHVSCNADFKEALNVARCMGWRVLKFDIHSKVIQTDQAETVKPKTKQVNRLNPVACENVARCMQKKFMLRSKVVPAQVQTNKIYFNKCSRQDQISSELMVYARMLSAGVPWEAVKQRMNRDGYKLASKYENMLRAKVPFHAVMNQMNIDGVQVQTQKNQAKITRVIPEVRRNTYIKTEEELPKIYSNMLQYGVPYQAVVLRMRRDGYSTNNDMKTVSQKARESLKLSDGQSRTKLLSSIKSGKKLVKTKPLLRSSPRSTPRSKLCAEIRHGTPLRPQPVLVPSPAPIPPPIPPAPISAPIPQPLPQPDDQPYANQLEQLRAMGFYDERQNVSLLSAHNGEVELVVNSL
eukprot:CAMPEP_0114403758 /NCGR_PEP_ID=MMETSP0102-20121206/19081_1 /TAXON_ID=38822 ORGANISM="Pteridomonas danica, Strain PT" /NCGR_SAMPLE_ID=MMETSP0102 /ASSEMBLY_ACC=CAM_ASM_000212 /LENGTH=404 /DNA_ID=CAMNT_0001568183 /DNA_START=42 /DNA_END=1252 /DNA_ORIENTATION=-